MLAQELAKRMVNFGVHELNHLRDDVEYSGKLDCLQRAYSKVKFILEQVGVELE